MASEGAGGSELTELVANHILGDVYRHVLAAVMHRDGVTHKLRENGGPEPIFSQKLTF